MAAHFDHAQPLPINKCNCGLCGSNDKVLKIEAWDLIAACPICSRMNEITHDSDILTKCLHTEGAYCPYCNCDYITEKDTSKDGKAETKATIISNSEVMFAKFLKIFIGNRSISIMQEEIRRLIWERPALDADVLGCEGLCKLICEIIEKRMHDNEKKEHLNYKIMEVIKPMNLLKQHCFDGSTKEKSCDCRG